jgi:hypothetical protein
MKSPIQLFIAMAILLATATVAAQVYKWVDKEGHVQYTDAPPPTGASKAEAKKVETGASAASTSATPAPSLQDRAKAYDKRRSDAADVAKKAEEARKKDDDASENCKSARAALRDLESGRPIKRTNDQGEITVMNDEAREAETARVRAAAAASCKA